MTSHETTLTSHPNFVAGNWVLDPVHSELSFSVRHMAISKVRGTFEDFSVTIDTTAGTPQVTATVQVASVNTNQEARDNHLRTSDFFKADEYPTATFTSTGFEVSGDEFVLHGDLTLRGVTKPVSLNGEFGGVITDSNGGTRAGASASTTITRTEFGVNYNAPLETGGLLLGEDITLSADLQVVLQK